jgi:hypothetical protein
MKELPPPQPPEPCNAGHICGKIKQDSKIHLIVAALLALFVTVGYFPSGEGPKFEPIEQKTVPATATADTRAAIDKENAEIDKKNVEGREEAAKAMKKWEKSGRENEAAMRLLAKFAAGLLAALWVVFFVCSYLVKPLLKFLKDFLGEDFAKVITPLFLLGIAYVLATIVLQNTVKELTGHGFVVTWIAYANHILRPFLGFIIEFTEFVVKNWTVGVAYLLIIVYAIVRKFAKPVE